MKTLLLATVLFVTLPLGHADADQPTYDFDFEAPLYGPPIGDDQQTTLAVDSVGGSDANAGTLQSPKLTLPTSLASNAYLGLYRGSLFRASLPLATIPPNGSITVRGLSLAAGALPTISGLDQVPNASFMANGDGTYSYYWTPTDPLDNNGYQNVYVVEINTSTEATTTVSSRRRMVDGNVFASVNSQSVVAANPSYALIQAPGTGTGQSGSTTQWKTIIHPSDSLAPGSGAYRYEVVSRAAPAPWYTGNGYYGGAMSGVQLVGSNNGYGPLSGPTGFVGDRLVVLHNATHCAVLGGGSLQRSVFYEMGDSQSIMLAWYANDPTGLSWAMSNCVFYGQAPGGITPPNFVIAHSGGGAAYTRGDISDCAFIGGRLANGALGGVVYSPNNVAQTLMDRCYAYGVGSLLGTNFWPGLEIKRSVFRQVGSAIMPGSFHDNIVACESQSDPNNVDNRGALGAVIEGSATAVQNNLFWLHATNTSGLASDNSAIFLSANGYAPNVTRNIVVLDAPAAGYAIYANFGANASLPTMDYNLVIHTGGTFAVNFPSSASWADYVANSGHGTDQHSLYVDLRGDPRGLQGVFVDPVNGDFRWAQTVVAQQCQAYCQANGVGPATVTTHWPVVPTVDNAVKAISQLPPKAISPGAVTFTQGVYGEYQISTDLDGTPAAPTSYSATGLPAWASVNTTSGVISGTPPQAGNFSLTVGATNVAGTGSASLAITVQASFPAWQKTYFTAAELSNPAVSGPTATPAGDGIPNLTKYALGLAPKSDGTSALPTISFAAVGSSRYLTLTYNKWLAASDVVYAVEVSGDLQTWSSGASYTATVSTTNNAASTMQTVVQRDLTATSSGAQRFIRLKINQP